MGRDFNAHAVEWGSSFIDRKDDCTLGLDLVLLNRGRVSIFARRVHRRYHTATPAAASRVREWIVEATSGSRPT